MLHNILDLSNDHTLDLVKDIKSSKYLEHNLNDNNLEQFDDLTECIISMCEPMYNALQHNEKSFFTQKKLEIASSLDETDLYTKCNFSAKLSIKLIQNGFLEKNNLSSILFLSEYYSKQIYLIDHSDKVYFNTMKSKDHSIYISQKDSEWVASSDIDKDKFKNVDEFPKINKDFNGFIYDPIKSVGIFPLSKYKMDDIVTLANKHKISLMKNGKKKVKKEIYNDIFLFLLNKS